MLWRTLQMANIDLHVTYKEMPLPRQGDSVFMQLIALIVTGQDHFASLNRCRCALHIMFLSDITSADGRKLRSELVKGRPTALCSLMRFPRDCPTSADWKLWEEFWDRYTYDGFTLWKPLGNGPAHLTCSGSGFMLRRATNLWSTWMPVYRTMCL